MDRVHGVLTVDWPSRYHAVVDGILMKGAWHG
jgi:hypothetical protein